MRRPTELIGSCVLGLAVLSSACTEDEPSPRGAPPAQLDQIFAASYPPAYIAQRLIGEGIGVGCVLEPGEDPLTWTPDPDRVQTMQRSRLILLHGAGLEPWAGVISLPRSRVVDTTAGLHDRLIMRTGALTHTHGVAGEHSHDLPESSTWLDPELFAAQAEAVAGALTREFPERTGEIQTNLHAVLEDLAALDVRMLAVRNRNPDLSLVARTEGYAYLAERLGASLDVIEDNEEQPEGSVLLVPIWTEDIEPAAVVWPIGSAPLAHEADLISAYHAALDELVSRLAE